MDDNTRSIRARYYKAEYFDPKKTQCEMALEYLKKFDTITPLEALTAFNCMRLSARISDLRADGHNITKVTHKGKKNYAIYKLEEEEYV